MYPYRGIFRNPCHLQVKIEHRSYLVVKSCNFSLEQVGEKRKLKLNELDEIHLEVYENSMFYAKEIKRFHDSSTTRNDFVVGQQVLFYNSILVS